MTDPKQWIVREMTVNLSNEQMLQAVLGIAKVCLGESECYVSKVTEDNEGGFNISILGSE